MTSVATHLYVAAKIVFVNAQDHLHHGARGLLLFLVVGFPDPVVALSHVTEIALPAHRDSDEIHHRAQL